MKSCGELEEFRQRSDNLYEKVRATLFLYALFRFFLQEGRKTPSVGHAPYHGYLDLLGRRFEQALDCFYHPNNKPSGTLFSALAETYHQLTFDTLYQQVRQSVRSSRGNQYLEQEDGRIFAERLELTGPDGSRVLADAEIVSESY